MSCYLPIFLGDFSPKLQWENYINSKVNLFYLLHITDADFDIRFVFEEFDQL